MMGQIMSSIAKGGKAYLLKMQSGYGRSDHERYGKGREDIRSEMQSKTSDQLTNSMIKEKERTC